MSSNQYPSVSGFFNKLKKDNLNDKNSFVAGKLNEAIDKTLNQDSCEENCAQNTQEDVRTLHEKIGLLEKELKQAKTLLRRANDINMQKDLQIQTLKQQLSSNKQPTEKSELLFGNHANRFDSTDIRQIRSIKSGRQYDSTFILAIMRALYRSEEDKIKDRRVTARKYNSTTKLEITADKKQMMQEMFEERVIAESDAASENAAIEERLKKLNEHMRHALRNAMFAAEKKTKKSNYECR